ncbi:uncharacterized protein LOC108224004 isoform X2 [Daucus carota subsp. sativus]|uniref:uncharacterized protein LOC108224004 isoform X2 n=1 Tax=Daucus carota subsp. sativus TaxID=79200 RepID=UPI0007F03D67|nr:PREDICTED: uncharacterized protein LOC108224004 isoform X2 [Daucus carota subsp. sativus]
MIFVPVFDDSDGGSESQPMEPRNIYKAEVDMSGVPKIFGRFEGGGSLYQYPEDDTELLGLCWTPSAKMRWIGGKFDRTKACASSLEKHTIVMNIQMLIYIHLRMFLRFIMWKWKLKVVQWRTFLKC